MKDECFRCKEPIDWESIPWDIKLVKNYRSRVHKCKCGHEQARFIPNKGKERNWWMKILGQPFKP